jgi:short-subunit dehydrogenase
MEKKKRIVIIGATSAIAEHCARYWLHEASIDLTLVGRDLTRTERIAADLRVRSPQSIVRVMQADFFEPRAIQNTVDVLAAEGNIDIALIAHGALPNQDVCQMDLITCHQALEINAISPALYAEALAMHFAKVNHGTLALISSVAGDRGRKSNYVYGAAKGLVTRYAQGLQHRFAKTNVRIVLINPGPTDTPMTAHLKEQGAKLASVEKVALQVVQAIQAGRRVAYVPKQWQWIMGVIRCLPASVFHRLNI